MTAQRNPGRLSNRAARPPVSRASAPGAGIAGGGSIGSLGSGQPVLGGGQTVLGSGGPSVAGGGIGSLGSGQTVLGSGGPSVAGGGIGPVGNKPIRFAGTFGR